MLSEKIRSYRKQAGMSQEQLAEKLNVSRQAVTKWETGVGIPDIVNLKGLSKQFSVSLDELVEDGKTESVSEYIYESITEYDIDKVKHYDIHFGSAKEFELFSYDGEKLYVELYSNKISDLQKEFKVKIDDVKDKTDIDIKHGNGVTEAEIKADLHIKIRLPKSYLFKVDFSGQTEVLLIHDIELENIEYDGKATDVILDSISSHIELNVNSDMLIKASRLRGKLDLNQLSSSSRLIFSENHKIMTFKKGIKNKIILKGMEETENAELEIELNGMKSELIISSDEEV